MFGPGEGFAGDLGVVIFNDVEDLIEERECVKDGLDVRLLQLAVIGGGVGVADEIEDGGAGFGCVEVVGERGGECICGFA